MRRENQKIQGLTPSVLLNTLSIGSTNLLLVTPSKASGSVLLITLLPVVLAYLKFGYVLLVLVTFHAKKRRSEVMTNAVTNWLFGLADNIIFDVLLYTVLFFYMNLLSARLGGRVLHRNCHSPHIILR